MMTTTAINFKNRRKMRKIIRETAAIFIMVVVSGLAIAVVTFAVVKSVRLAYPEAFETKEAMPIVKHTPSATAYVAELEWQEFIYAVAEVESGHDPSAVGEDNDVGWLQITPIMVDDANRILGHKRFTLADRYSVDRSVDIWNVIQGYYNNTRDFATALRVWNPGAPQSYHDKVMAAYRRASKF